MFKMWEKRIGFMAGYYFYVDGEGNNSVISRQCANEEEESYQRYQARMDVDRGGMYPEHAFPSRGFEGSDYHWTYKHYETDDMTANEIVRPIAGRFVIPYQVGEYHINYIYDRAFCDCTELTEIMVPNYISFIGDEAFSGCTNLYYIKLTDQIASIGAKVFENTAYYDDKNNWSGPALYINNWLIKVNNDVTGEFTVPDHVVGIADEAFCDCCNLTKVNLPESVDHIGNSVFQGCVNLQEVVFPSKVSNYGYNVLKDCSNLAVLKLPCGVTKINGMSGNKVLQKCVLPEGLQSIGQEAFCNCINLREIKLPESLERIEDCAFKNTGYTNEPSNWSENVLYLDGWILDTKDEFSGKYEIQDKTVGIADQAFTPGWLASQGYESLSEIVMPDSVRHIGVGAFEKCRNLEKINLSKNLQSISNSLFRGNEKLKEITIPYSVKHMDIWVFYDCPSLEEVVIENPLMEIKWPAVYNCPKLTVYSHEGSKAQSYMKKYEINFEVITE